MKMDVYGWRWDKNTDDQGREAYTHRSVVAKHYQIVRVGGWWILRGGEIESCVNFFDRTDAMIAAMMMEYALLGHSEYVNSFGYPQWMGYAGSDQ